MPANYYSILQVHTDAEQEIIEAAYKSLARKYHPDINRTADANLQMQKINEAYEVLADCEKRTLYDQDNLHKTTDTDDLLRQLNLAESHLLDEQILREEIEEELATVTHQLRIEQLKRKRAERKSVRLVDQLKECPPKIRHFHPPSTSLAVASSKTSQLLLQRKYTLVERKLAGEQLHNQQLQEELRLAENELANAREALRKLSKKMKTI